MVTAKLLVCFGEGKSCQTKRLWLQMFGWAILPLWHPPLVANARPSFLIFFFSLCYCLPVLCEQLVLCILSFCINWQKRFATNPPRITFLKMFDKEPEQLKATVCCRDYYDDFCRSRREWHLFPTYLLPVFLYPKAMDFHLNDFGLLDVGCFSQRGKINQLKTMKMVL